jgi:hypothetical protein
VARAQTSGAFDTYENAGVTQYDVLLSDGACPECEAAADGGPYDLDDDSGRVPIHPVCRCANTPHINATSNSDGLTATGADDDISDES